MKTLYTEPYRASHWKAPCGRGLWAFTLLRGGSYTEALRQAKAEAKQLDCDTVAVQS